MRRLTATILCAGLLCCACKRRHHPNPAATIEEPGDLASSIDISDSRNDSQLLRGFHVSENPAWRWTMKKFAVSLAPPYGAARRGARLELRFALPEIVAAQLLGVSITPSVGSTKLAPCKPTKTGDQTCVFDVPPEALAGEGVIVEFELDKAIPPSAADSRELGLVVSRIAFLAK